MINYFYIYNVIKIYKNYFLKYFKKLHKVKLNDRAIIISRSIIITEELIQSVLLCFMVNLMKLLIGRDDIGFHWWLLLIRSETLGSTTPFMYLGSQVREGHACATVSTFVVDMLYANLDHWISDVFLEGRPLQYLSALIVDWVISWWEIIRDVLKIITYSDGPDNVRTFRINTNSTFPSCQIFQILIQLERNPFPL